MRRMLPARALLARVDHTAATSIPTGMSLPDAAIQHAQNAAARASATAPTLERAARRVCEALYHELLLPDDVPDRRACVLVRSFATQRLAALDAERRRIAEAALGAAGTDDVPCLVLLGSCGMVPEWNDPSRSRAHRVIPLATPSALERMPMFSSALRAFGHAAASLWDPPASAPARLGSADRIGAFEVYQVDPAAGSPHVPDQDGFVHRYRVASVLGFGGPLRTGELYMTLLFLRCGLSRDAVRRVRALALDVTTTFFRYPAERTLDAPPVGAMPR